MAVDVLFMEVWADEDRYRDMAENFGIAYLKAALDSRTSLKTGMLNSNRLYFPADQSMCLSIEERLLAQIDHHGGDKRKLILGLSATSWRMPDLQKLVEAVRTKYPTMPIITGGYGPTFEPERALAAGATVVCIGEGDDTVVDLVTTLRNRGDLAGVNGIAFLQGGKVIHTPPRRLVDVKSLPMPSLKYLNGRHKYAIESTYAHRGCPHRCAFCWTPRFSGPGEGARWRPKSALQLYEEVRYRKQHNNALRHVIFADDNFLVHGAFLCEFRHLLLEDQLTRGVRIKYETGATEINRQWNVIEDCIDITSAICFGYESHVRDFLVRQRKGPVGADMVEENHRALKKLQEAKKKYGEQFDYHVYFILTDKDAQVAELADIYPTWDDIDRLEWAARIITHCWKTVIYFDERDDQYPLFVRAYLRFMEDLHRFSGYLPWVAKNCRGRHRSTLERAIKAYFDEAFRAAEIVHNIYGRKVGQFESLTDTRVKIDIDEVISRLNQDLSLELSRATLDIFDRLFIKRPYTGLREQGYFPGFADRLLARFGKPDSIPIPVYVKALALIATELYRHRQMLGRLADNTGISEGSNLIAVYRRRAFELTCSIAERGLVADFGRDGKPYVSDQMFTLAQLLSHDLAKSARRLRRPPVRPT